MRWSIKTALTLTFALLASLPVLVGGFFAVDSLTTSMEKEFADRNLLLANSCARELERSLDHSQQRLQYLAQLLADGSLAGAESLDDYLAREVSGNKDLELLRVLNEDGIVVHLAPFDPSILGADMSRQAYAVAADREQSVQWSNVFISPQTGASTLVLAIPFTGGMLVGHLSLESVREITESVGVGPGAVVSVVDRNGIAIAHHNQALAAQRSNLSNHAHIGWGLAGHEGTLRYMKEREQQIGSVAVVRGTGWVVAVSQSLSEVFRPIESVKRIVYTAALSAVIIAVVAALLGLKIILAPLKKITEDAREIAGGNYALEPAQASYSEIAELRDSFEVMIGEVAAREDSLRESEGRFRATFEQAAVGIAHVSKEGRFLRINQKFCDIMGFTRDEMQSYTFQSITHPEDVDVDVADVRRLLRGEADSYALDKRYIRKGGGIVWASLTVTLLRDDAGEPLWFVSVVEDITSRKQAEESLRELRAYTDHLIETANVMIVALDIEGHVTHFNPAAEAITGYSLPEVRGKDWFELLAPPDRYPQVHDEFDRLARGGVPHLFENPILTKDGRERHISWTNSEVVREGEVVGITSFGLDLTERRDAQAELVQSEESFRQLMEQSPLSIQLVATDGRITKVNRAWMDLWGISIGDLPDTLAMYNMLEDEEAKERGIMPLITKAFKGEAVVLPVIEYDAQTTMQAIGLTRGRARKRWIQARLYPLKDETGRVSSVVTIEEDITDQRLAEERIQAYQDRLRALASDLTLTEERERRRIASELHDGAAQSLAFARIQLASSIKAVADPEVAGKLDDLSQLLKESLQQIRQALLDLSSPALNEIGLAAALSEWLEEHVGRRHGLRVTFDDRSGKVPLTDDVRAVLFRNARELLVNVVKHAKATHISVSISASDEALCITVLDDGTGFDPEAVAQQPTRDGAFGVFSVRERMADMGGSLEIDSAPGKGCKATLITPLAGGKERNAT